MATSDTFREVQSFFLRPDSPRSPEGAVFHVTVPDQEDRTEAAREVARPTLPTSTAKTRPRFSAFIPELAEKAVDIAGRMAQSQPKEDQTRTQAALDLANLLKPTEEAAGLVDHALQIFVTHDPEARAFVDAIPSPLERFADAAGRVVDFDFESGHALPDPDGMEWMREDPFLNEHHEHWHIVYPFDGVAGPDGTKKIKDRQGELFFYMHQQMIARYNAELDAMGIEELGIKGAIEQTTTERLVPYDDFGQGIAQGYQPGPDHLFHPETNPDGFVARAPGLPTPERSSDVLSRQDLIDRRQRLSEAISKGNYPLLNTPVTMTIDNLGATIEPTTATVSPPLSGIYAGYHGAGHVLISRIGALPRGVLTPGTPPSFASGVMLDTAAAIRDPIFWRWHKAIDILGNRFTDTLPKQDFSDAPYVFLRTEMEPGSSPSADILFFETAKHWRSPCPVVADPREVTGCDPTDILHTTLAKRSVVLRTGTRVSFDKLEHTEFAFAFKVTNQMPRLQTVTGRVFIAPITDKEGSERTEDRFAWIELDKFLFELPPLAEAWVVRHGSDSSVVRKPGSMNPMAVEGQIFRLDEHALSTFTSSNPKPADIEMFKALAAVLTEPVKGAEAFRVAVEEAFPGGPDAFAIALRSGLIKSIFLSAAVSPGPRLGDANDSYCRCGWPYHLLIPRGTATGMPFRIMVVLTDWDEDRVGPPGCCGSASLCGAVDKYPDKRPMGYPFDRRWPGKIKAVVPFRRNMAFRDFTILHEDLRTT